MVSGEGNKTCEEASSRRVDYEKEPSVEAAVTNVAAQGDVTEVKKMLETFLKEQKEQAKINEATSKELKALSRRKRGRPDTTRHKARVDPQRLDFSAHRTAWRNLDDLPPPPPRRESDKFPDRIVEISNGDQPAPQKRARAEGADDTRQELRAPYIQSVSGSSKTEILKDTSEYTNYSSKEQYRKEQERRALKLSYATKLGEMRAQVE
ncbi:hypothetical protein AALP_AA6G222900 [Arabis alpina]|uniref:Uncharacterized protein n=1 Tax=Arabis alpina TaxID=50452 RepID=A0A087GQY6_ARAAL|nr:hypothetical protein AALP_AA6G222900 [Arabis alpina]